MRIEKVSLVLWVIVFVLLVRYALIVEKKKHIFHHPVLMNDKEVKEVKVEFTHQGVNYAIICRRVYYRGGEWLISPFDGQRQRVSSDYQHFVDALKRSVEKESPIGRRKSELIKAGKIDMFPM